MGNGAGIKKKRAAETKKRKKQRISRKSGARTPAPRDREATRNMTAKERQQDRRRRDREAGIPERTAKEAQAAQRRARAWFDSFRP